MSFSDEGPASSLFSVPLPLQSFPLVAPGSGQLCPHCSVGRGRAGPGVGWGGTELRPCGASTPHLLVPVDGLWVQGPSRGGVTVPPAVLTLEVETNSFIAGRVVGTAPALARGSDHHLCVSLVGPRRTVVLGQVVHGVFQEEISEGVSDEQSRPPAGRSSSPLEPEQNRRRVLPSTCLSSLWVTIRRGLGGTTVPLGPPRVDGRSWAP